MSAEVIPASGAEPAPRSALADIARRFARDRAALAALVLLLAIALAALAAPVDRERRAASLAG